MEELGAKGERLLLELQGALDDEPSDVALAGEFGDLRGGVGVYGVVHHKHGELGGASGGEVEEIFAGKHEDGVGSGDLRSE